MASLFQVISLSDYMYFSKLPNNADKGNNNTNNNITNTNNINTDIKMS